MRTLGVNNSVNLRVLNKFIRQNMDKISFGHFSVGEGVITVAGVLLDNGWFHYGVSLCSPLDTFCRKTGRENATRNLFNRTVRMCGACFVINHEKMSPWEVVEKAAKNFVWLGKLPKWLEKTDKNVSHRTPLKEDVQSR